MFKQAFIHSTHKSAYAYQGRPSEVLRDSLLKKWDQSDVDPKEFKRITFVLDHLLCREVPNFVKENSDSKSKYTEEDIIKMLEFKVDNIFKVFAGKVFQQIIGIPMGTNCAPLLADLFLNSYEAEFIQSLLSAGRKW